MRQFASMGLGLMAVALAACSPSASTVSEPSLPQMSQDRMHAIIGAYTVESQIDENVMQFSYNERILYCISDVHHDRMRIIAPIIESNELTEDIKDKLLISNFHSALDARYAVSDEMLYAAFIHPLSRLTEEEVESAIRQVATLADTFGSTYSSGDLSYGDSSEPEDEPTGVQI
jgi:hypothetical protein